MAVFVDTADLQLSRQNYRDGAGVFTLGKQQLRWIQMPLLSGRDEGLEGFTA